MKHDTSIFATLAISKYFNFVGEGQRADPFLIQSSVSGNVVAGNKIRAIKQREGDIIKRTLPLGDEDMTKAKACEEMIMYERPVSAAVSKSGGQASTRGEPSTIYVFPAPSTVVLGEFEKAVASFIDETQPQTNEKNIGINQEQETPYSDLIKNVNSEEGKSPVELRNQKLNIESPVLAEK